jgi:hypothetical protein
VQTGAIAGQGSANRNNRRTRRCRQKQYQDKGVKTEAVEGKEGADMNEQWEVQTGELEKQGGEDRSNSRTRGADRRSRRKRRCIHEQWQDEEAQTGVVEGLAGRDRSFIIL